MQCSKLRLPMLFTFLQQAQAIAHNFACAGIATTLDKVAHECLIAGADAVPSPVIIMLY